MDCDRVACVTQMAKHQKRQKDMKAMPERTHRVMNVFEWLSPAEGTSNVGMNQQMFTSSRYCYIISACILNADGFFAKNDIQLWTLQRILPKRSVVSCDNHIAYTIPLKSYLNGVLSPVI